MGFGLLPLPPPLPFLALRASCSSPAADASASCRGGSGLAGNVVRLSVWVVCLVVAPQVVCCPHPCPPPRGRGQFGGVMLSGCRFGLCVWSLLRGLWCAETAMAVGLLPLPPPQPSPAAGFALQGREWFGGECCPVVGLGCVFGRCSVGCGVQKRQWRLDCCLYPLPDPFSHYARAVPVPLRASPCGGGSGSVVGSGLRVLS